MINILTRELGFIVSQLNPVIPLREYVGEPKNLHVSCLTLLCVGDVDIPSGSRVIAGVKIRHSFHYSSRFRYIVLITRYLQLQPRS